MRDFFTSFALKKTRPFAHFCEAIIWFVTKPTGNDGVPDDVGDRRRQLRLLLQHLLNKLERVRQGLGKLIIINKIITWRQISSLIGYFINYFKCLAPIQSLTFISNLFAHWRYFNRLQSTDYSTHWCITIRKMLTYSKKRKLKA